MSYSGLQMLRSALAPGEFTDVSGPPSQKSNTAADLPDTQLIDAIAEADSVIDSYIGGYYATPVQPVGGTTPHPIDYWSRTIAAFFATMTFRRGADLADADPIIRRYNAAMANLNAVRSGQATLPIPPNTGDAASGGAGRPINPYSGTLFGTQDFDLADTRTSQGQGQPGAGYEWGWGQWNGGYTP